MVTRALVRRCPRIRAIERLVLHPTGPSVRLERKTSVAQRLAHQDVVQQKRVLAGRDRRLLDRVTVLSRPPQVAREIEQRVVEEALREQHLALKVPNEIEEEVLAFEQVVTWTIVSVAHQDEARLSELIELCVDVVPNVTRFRGELLSS